MLGKVPSLTTQETLKTRNPFGAGSSSDPTGAPLDSLLTPLTHSHTRFPHQFDPTAVSGVSFCNAICSWHSNTETPGAGASEEDPQQWNPWAFIPSQSTCTQILLFLPSPCSRPPLCVQPARWHHPSPCPLLSERSAIPGSFRVSLRCRSPWLAPPVLVPFVIPKAGSSQPLVSLGSRPDLNLHLNLQSANRAPWTRCVGFKTEVLISFLRYPPSAGRSAKIWCVPVCLWLLNPRWAASTSAPACQLPSRECRRRCRNAL